MLKGPAVAPTPSGQQAARAGADSSADIGCRRAINLDAGLAQTVGQAVVGMRPTEAARGLPSEGLPGAMKADDDCLPFSTSAMHRLIGADIDAIEPRRSWAQTRIGRAT